jgi:hypothetical protein
MKVGGLMKLLSSVVASSMSMALKKALSNLKGILEKQV